MKLGARSGSEHIRHADDLKPIAGDIVDEVSTLDLDILHSGCKSRAEQ